MMNKIIKPFKKILKAISKFIDKKIILPITSFCVGISKKIKINK